MKAKELLQVFRANPGLALGLLAVLGSQVVLAGGGGTNPLATPMQRIQGIICAVVDAATGPFGAALAILMLALGFGGLIIGNRNSMGLIITAIAGGALLLAAKALGNSILNATGCS